MVFVILLLIEAISAINICFTEVDKDISIGYDAG